MDAVESAGGWRRHRVTSWALAVALVMMRLGTRQRRGEAHSDPGAVQHIRTESYAAAGMVPGPGLPGTANH
jgi:hypothetical protein